MLKKIAPDTFHIHKEHIPVHNPFELPQEDIQNYFYDADEQRLLCMPDHDAFYEVLTSRNYPLVTPEQQQMLRQAKIAIAGQGTVGGNLAIALVRHGFEHLLTSDPDSFDISNLNRQATDLFSIGKNKARHTAAQLTAINPFVKVAVVDALSMETISAFVREADVVVSALDNPALIIALNREARAQKKPLLLGTDLGNKVLFDVFDYRQDIPLLHGRFQDGDENLPVLHQIIKIVGYENIPLEMLDAVQRLMRREIEYITQTNVAAQVCASMLLTGIKHVVLDEPILPTSYIDVLAAVEPAEKTDAREVDRLRALEALQQALSTL